MSTKRKPAEQIEPGDVIAFLGDPHMVAVVEPYTHPTIPAFFGIARAADGWGMSLATGTDVEVFAR